MKFYMGVYTYLISDIYYVQYYKFASGMHSSNLFISVPDSAGRVLGLHLEV